MDEPTTQILSDTQHQLTQILHQPSPPLPHPAAMHTAHNSIYSHLPETGRGLKATTTHLLSTVCPGLNNSSLSPTYWGFVTGGITPAARVAEHIVSTFDQNVCVHLPEESIATVVEDRALCMLLELLGFEAEQWKARVFNTGATAGNVQGLACGREYVLGERSRRRGLERREGEGVLSACLRAAVEKFQVLTTMPHSSLGKAANIVGIGSEALVDVSRSVEDLAVNMARLEELLADEKAASVVVVSCGEVNTGAFATHGQEMQDIRRMCDRYGAWLHVDGAFGLFARVLPSAPQYATVRTGTAGLELADSIASDAHKLLNVPYDCGFFFCRHLDIPSQVFANTNAAYLSNGPSGDSIPSSLNLRLENSARFRGLPVYATLLAYGRGGYAEMIARMTDVAREVAQFIKDDCPHLELLPNGVYDDNLKSMFMIVLFRAKDEALNEVLVKRIKQSGKVYASGTKWAGRSAVRFAIAKWDIDVDRDVRVAKSLLNSLA